LAFQVPSHELPIPSRVHGTINPSFGQGEKDAVIHRIDEQLPDRLVVQAIVYGAPRTPAVSGAKDAMFSRPHVEGVW